MPDNRKLLLLVYSVRLCNIAGDRLIVKRDLSHKWAARFYKLPQHLTQTGNV